MKRRNKEIKREDIIKTIKQIIADGNSIENNIIIGSDIRCIGHFGNTVSLDIWATNCSLFHAYNNTDNIGWQIKALVELFDLTDEDGFLFSKFRNIPCRIITSGRFGSKVIGFGHFMKDKFIYTDDFAKITD
jgi:hypothetical protein